MDHMNIKCKFNSIFSIDAVNMYLSVKFNMIKKAAHYFFLHDTSDADRETANWCLDLIKFEMAHIFIVFEDQY